MHSNKKNKWNYLILMHLAASLMNIIHAAEVTTPEQTIEQNKKTRTRVDQIAQVIFNPVMPSDPNKPNPYPETSMNASLVDQLFGPSGLHVNATTLRNIKNFYFYLEFLVRLEIATKMALYAKNNNLDAMTILEKKDGWKELVAQTTKKAGSWKALMQALKTIPEGSIASVQQAIDISKWQDVPKTDFWKHIPLTVQDLIQSDFWQRYIKYIITKSFDQDKLMLASLQDVEKRKFLYIPSLEITYYHQDFVYLRQSAEYFRLRLDLDEWLRRRFIKDCIDWKAVIGANKKINSVELYKKAEEFTKSDFYQLIHIADQDVNKILAHARDPQGKLAQNKYIQNPIAHNELNCFAMIRNLQAQLNYLFDVDHVTKTMEVLARQSKKPEPSILLYDAQDKVYVHDLAYIQHLFEFAGSTEKEIASTQIKKETDEKATLQAFLGWGKKFEKWTSQKADVMVATAKETWKDVKQTGTDIAKGATDAWQGVPDTAKFIWSEAKAVGFIVSDNPEAAAQQMKKSKALQQKVTGDLKDMFETSKLIVDDIHAVIKGSTSYLADAFAIGLADLTSNVQLAENLAGALKAGTNIILGIAQSLFLDIVVVPSAALIYLITDIAVLTTKTIVDAVDGIVRGQFGDLGDDLSQLVSDVASTLWSTVSFLGKRYYVDLMQEGMQLIGYITLSITDLAIDLTTAFLYGLAAISVESRGDIKNAAEEVKSHRRFIASIVNTALLIGAIVATDGLAAPTLAAGFGTAANVALMGGMSGFMVAGAYQEDELAKREKLAKQEAIDGFVTFVENNKIVLQHAQESFKDELSKKMSAEITNQERELGFYQNFMQNYFEQSKEQMAFYAGSHLAPQLVPDEKTKLRFADVGSLYGFKTGDGQNTGLLNLNPSQGFALYNKGRDTFSQEIAVYPAISKQMEGKEYRSQIIRKFWFNQKETLVLDKPTDEVEIRFQTIYILKNFILGLYFGGEAIDVQSIIKTKKMPIDAGHNAKMLVYRKDAQYPKPTLKLYEHEGKGWFNETISGPTFKMGVWYRMKMQLNGASLQLKVWQEGESEPGWQSFKVNKTEQKTVGVIASGASIQYQIIKPEVAITPVTSVRPEITWTTEIERAQRAAKTMDQLLTPNIGKLDLQATGREQILKGQYVYKSQISQLKDDKNKITDDYFILGTQAGSVEAPIILNQGASPMQEIIAQDKKVKLKDYPSAASVSLVTGNAFDKEGKRITTCANVLGNFVKENGQLTTQLTERISALSKQYLKKLLGPFKFGTIELNATSEQDLEKGQFIYKALSPETELRKNDKALQDEKGVAFFDYFMTVNKNGILGEPLTGQISQIQSLVTGNVYERKSTKPVQTGYQTGSRALDTYARALGDRRKALDEAIDRSAKKYAEIKKITQQELTKELKVVTVQQTKAEDVSKETEVYAQRESAKAPEVTTKPAPLSLLKRSEQAEMGEMAWGL